MNYILEYSQKRAFYFSENDSHDPSSNIRLLSRSISYEDLKEFSKEMHELYPVMWTKELNPKFEVIKKHFEKFIRK